MMTNQISEDIELQGVNNLVRLKAFEPTRDPRKRHISRKVLVSGRSDEIDIVMQTACAANPNIATTPDPNSLSFKDYTFLAAEPRLAEYTTLEVRQYSLNGSDQEEDVWLAVKTIFESSANAKGGPYLVFADPNLVMGNSVGGGSGGASGGPNGAAIGVPLINGKGMTPSEVFCSHWAFGGQQANQYIRRWGINLEKAPGQRKVSQTGAGVRAFILDTFDPVLYASGVSLPNLTCGSTPLPPIYLLVSSLATGDTSDAYSGPDKNVQDHGVFVSGLLHRVAPDCELHLVQVLNEYGQGELFTLAKVLTAAADFGMQTPVEPDLPLSNVVVNLSLEANFSEEKVLALGVRDAIQALWKQVEKNYNDQDILQRLLKEMTKGFYYLPSLRIPILILNQMGAVIVAAAGNESVDYYGHLPMSIPARYSEVIGVAATNYQGKLANFSNTGDVCAPGGGVEDPEDPVEDVSDIISAGRDPRLLAMVSLVPQDGGPCQDGLAYWWGTSFSTPLVSGLAALIQEKVRKTSGKGLPPEEVIQRIKDCVKNDVINIAAALQ